MRTGCAVPLECQPHTNHSGLRGWRGWHSCLHLARRLQEAVMNAQECGGNAQERGVNAQECMLLVGSASSGRQPAPDARRMHTPRTKGTRLHSTASHSDSLCIYWAFCEHTRASEVSHSSAKVSKVAHAHVMRISALRMAANARWMRRERCRRMHVDAPKDPRMRLRWTAQKP